MKNVILIALISLDLTGTVASQRVSSPQPLATPPQIQNHESANETLHANAASLHTDDSAPPAPLPQPTPTPAEHHIDPEPVAPTQVQPAPPPAVVPDPAPQPPVKSCQSLPCPRGRMCPMIMTCAAQ